jgi:hypothetical protein
MKYMLLIHQVTTPLPGSPEWEALPDDEKGRVYADYQAINETPGMTPGVQMASPETATTVRVQDGRTLTTDGPFAVSQRPTVRIGVTEGALREGHPAGWVWSVVSVNLGVAGVGVAHPFLDRAQRRAGRRHLCAEGVAQLVERDHPHVGGLQRVGEAFAHLGGIENVAAEGVGEHEVLGAAPARALEVTLDLLGEEAVGHRHRAPVIALG